ncbi:MAG: AAA family ATPase, partial [Dysgonamonadaceae bacterium]|nr:AAA family ATPase [Dysgonamonadaceae bacterium]
VWNPDALYAVEHDYMDATFTGMFRALATFLHANQDRKELILGTRDAPSPFTCFLLIGPPGSGKTSIALKQMVETELQKNGANILLLSYTNRAVDEICKALSDISRSLPYIRVGSELNCAPEFRPHLLENSLEKCNNRQDVAEVIRRCRIFVGTAASVWNKPELFRLKHFDLAIIDEATQLLEPHLLGIFCARNISGENAVDRFVLIGDHKQLPAVVLQSKEESRVNEPVLNAAGLTDLSNSLFERLYRKYNEEGLASACAMLTRQGRMHPDISAFPSKHFYDNRLETVGLPHQTEEWTHRNRLHFYSVKPLENELSDKANLNEALKVVDICRGLYLEYSDAGSVFNSGDIGIITPYRNQIALIRKKLQETGIEKFADITVDTVERFQGSQRDTIIYSFCVKKESQLAALPNWMEENGKRIDRKLNVALTRARKQLFIVGNAELLCKNEIYRNLIEHILLE